MESELLAATQRIKTIYPDAMIDIPNPLASSFILPHNMLDVHLHPMTIQYFLKIKSSNNEKYDFIWMDLCQSLIGTGKGTKDNSYGNNSEILPLIMETDAIMPCGYLAITCCLRGCDYEKSMDIIKREMNNKFSFILEKTYQPAMLFLLLQKNSV